LREFPFLVDDRALLVESRVYRARKIGFIGDRALLVDSIERISISQSPLG